MNDLKELIAELEQQQTDNLKELKESLEKSVIDTEEKVSELIEVVSDRLAEAYDPNILKRRILESTAKKLKERKDQFQFFDFGSKQIGNVLEGFQLPQSQLQQQQAQLLEESLTDTLEAQIVPTEENPPESEKQLVGSHYRQFNQDAIQTQNESLNGSISSSEKETIETSQNGSQKPKNKALEERLKRIQQNL